MRSKLLLYRSHQLFSLDGPINHKLCFFPSGVHRLCLKQDDYEKVAVLLKASRETGTCRLCNASFGPWEAINAEQTVCIAPIVEIPCIAVDRFKFFFLSTGRWRLTAWKSLCLRGGWSASGLWNRYLYGALGSALESLGAHNLSKERNLHADAGQSGHIVGSWEILLIHKPVWRVKEAIHKFEWDCVIIHLFEEILDEVRMVIKLETSDTLHVTLVIPTLFEY